MIFVVYMAYSGDDPETVMANQLAVIQDDPALASLSAVANNRVHLIMLGDMYASAPHHRRHSYLRPGYVPRSALLMGCDRVKRPASGRAPLYSHHHRAGGGTCVLSAGGCDLWHHGSPLSDVYTVLLYRLRHALLGTPFPEAWAPGTAMHDVVWLIRLPRLVLAAAVGMALSVSGVVMQAIVKNPLADPYILGISSGASLGATVAVLLGVGVAFGSNYVGVMSFLGAFGVSMAVITLANIGGRATSVKLLLSGSALSAICSAFSSFIIYLADSDHATTQVVRWTMGSLAAAEWPGNGVMCLMAVGGTLFFSPNSAPWI